MIIERRESSERIQYIVDYIVSYKTKIEALNKKGLFDTATLYEIFAQIRLKFLLCLFV